jgi:hypothetical protein
LFQKLRQELVEGGGTDLCFMGKQIIMRLYESSYAVPARPSGRVSWKEVKVMWFGGGLRGHVAGERIWAVCVFVIKCRNIRSANEMQNIHGFRHTPE